MPTTKEVITDVACSSAQVNRTPRHVSQTFSGGTTPVDCVISVRSLWDKSPVIISGITVSLTSGRIGILQVFNKLQRTSPDKIRDTQKLDTSVDIIFPIDWNSPSIFSKVMGRELFHSSSGKPLPALYGEIHE